MLKILWQTIRTFMNPLSIFKKYLNSGIERSIKAKKNIAFSFLMKGTSIGISLLLVPMTLHYLNQTDYGIWLTLSSILGWVNFFDMGLGNGLRNKFAEARAKNDMTLTKIYVSTTFALIIVIVSVIFLLFIIINPFLDWTKILNTKPSFGNELSLTVLFVFVFFCLQFIFRVVNTILIADQRPSASDFINVLSSIFSLFAIYILMKLTKGSLLYVGITFSAMPVLILIGTYFFLFNGVYKDFKPSFFAIKFQYSKDLMGLGIQFFIIQMACLLVFASSNIIIAQLFGPAQVTPYNIASKYFYILIMIFNIIISPFWSAYTDAYYKSDFNWIKKSTNKIIQIWIYFVILTIIMIFSAKFVYKIWIGKDIKISFLLTSLMGLYVIINNWNNIFANFINGVGKIRLSLFSGIFSGIMNIPLAIYFGKLIGIEGVVLSSCICLLISSIWSPIQYNKIIQGNLRGIWGK